jgi:GAF domain-containing protein
MQREAEWVHRKALEAAARAVRDASLRVGDFAAACGRLAQLGHLLAEACKELLQCGHAVLWIVEHGQLVHRELVRGEEYARSVSAEMGIPGEILRTAAVFRDARPTEHPCFNAEVDVPRTGAGLSALLSAVGAPIFGRNSNLDGHREVLGALVATNKLGVTSDVERVFSEQDVWVLEALCSCAAPFLAADPALSLPAPAVATILRDGLCRSAPALASACLHEIEASCLAIFEIRGSEEKVWEATCLHPIAARGTRLDLHAGILRLAVEERCTVHVADAASDARIDATADALEFLRNDWGSYSHLFKKPRDSATVRDTFYEEGEDHPVQREAWKNALVVPVLESDDSGVAGVVAKVTHLLLMINRQKGPFEREEVELLETVASLASCHGVRTEAARAVGEASRAQQYLLSSVSNLLFDFSDASTPSSVWPT